MGYSHFIIARHELQNDGKQYEDDARQANETGTGQAGDVLIEAQGHNHAHRHKEDNAQANSAHGIAPWGKEANQNFR